MSHIKSLTIGAGSLAAGALLLGASWVPHQDAPGGTGQAQPSSAASPESYKLASAFTVGQKSRIHLDFSADLDILTTTKPQDTSTRSIFLHRQDEFLQEILEIQEGVPSSLGVTCERSTVHRSGAAVEPAGDKPTALAGLHLTLKRVQDSYQVEVVPSGVDASLLSALGRWMNFTKILPSDEKKIGDFWSVNSVSLLALFEGTVPVNLQGEMVCKLVRVVDGRAELSLSGTVKAVPQAKKDSQVQLTLTGTMIFDITQGQIQSVKLAGDLEIKRVLLDSKPSGDEELGAVTLKSRKLELTATFTPLE